MYIVYIVFRNANLSMFGYSKLINLKFFHPISALTVCAVCCVRHLLFRDILGGKILFLPRRTDERSRKGT